MDRDFIFLIEKEEMWAKMLLQVFKDNQVPAAALPVYGAGVVLRAGMQERYKIYVPRAYAQTAADLLQELFSGDNG